MNTNEIRKVFQDYSKIFSRAIDLVKMIYPKRSRRVGGYEYISCDEPLSSSENVMVFVAGYEKKTERPELFWFPLKYLSVTDEEVMSRKQDWKDWEGVDR